jgi:predicted neutral ceramidase superfamily lipid hydrolase
MKQSLKRNIQMKISDYTRYLYILLAVSTFLYLGTIIGNGEKALVQMIVMSGATVTLLALSFYFASKIKKLRQELDREEQ